MARKKSKKKEIGNKVIEKHIRDSINQHVEKWTHAEKYVILAFNEYETKDILPPGYKSHIAEPEMSHLILVSIRFIKNDIFQPIGTLFLNNYNSKSPTPKEMGDIFRLYILSLEDTYIRVVATVTPPTDTFKKALSNLTGISDLTAYNGPIVYTVDGKSEIVHIYDAPTMLKVVRNCLVYNDITYQYNGKMNTASWNNLKYLYKKGKLDYLSTQHIYPNMNFYTTRLAANVFSQRVSDTIKMAVLKGLLPEEAMGTSRLLKHFNDLFDTFNTTGKEKCVELRKVITKTSSHISFWMKSLKFLQTILLPDKTTFRKKISPTPYEKPNQGKNATAFSSELNRLDALSQDLLSKDAPTEQSVTDNSDHDIMFPSDDKNESFHNNYKLTANEKMNKYLATINVSSCVRNVCGIDSLKNKPVADEKSPLLANGHKSNVTLYTRERSNVNSTNNDEKDDDIEFQPLLPDENNKSKHFEKKYYIFTDRSSSEEELTSNCDNDAEKNMKSSTESVPLLESNKNSKAYSDADSGIEMKTIMTQMALTNVSDLYGHFDDTGDMEDRSDSELLLPETKTRTGTGHMPNGYLKSCNTFSESDNRSSFNERSNTDNAGYLSVRRDLCTISSDINHGSSRSTSTSYDDESCKFSDTKNKTKEKKTEPRSRITRFNSFLDTLSCSQTGSYDFVEATRLHRERVNNSKDDILDSMPAEPIEQLKVIKSKSKKNKKSKSILDEHDYALSEHSNYSPRDYSEDTSSDKNLEEFSRYSNSENNKEARVNQERLLLSSDIKKVDKCTSYENLDGEKISKEKTGIKATTNLGFESDSDIELPSVSINEILQRLDADMRNQKKETLVKVEMRNEVINDWMSSIKGMILLVNLLHSKDVEEIDTKVFNIDFMHEFVCEAKKINMGGGEVSNYCEKSGCKLLDHGMCTLAMKYGSVTIVSS